MKNAFLAGIAIVALPVMGQANSNMIEMCKAAGESQTLCSCGQAQADALMTPEVQQLVVAGMLTGSPPSDQLQAQGVTQAEVFDLMLAWSIAVEQNCAG